MQLCALCSQPAVVWCKADKAALCLGCDARTHSTYLASRHQRVPLAMERQAERPLQQQDGCSSMPDLLTMEDSANSIPTLDLLLEMNAAVDAAQLGPGSVQADLASLLSLGDPLAPLDFGGVDLSDLQEQSVPNACTFSAATATATALTVPSSRDGHAQPPTPASAAAAAAAAMSPHWVAPAGLRLPLGSLFDAELAALASPTTHSSGGNNNVNTDAVVPVLPPSPRAQQCPQLLAAEPPSPLSPAAGASRVITTGSAVVVRRQPASPPRTSAAALLGSAAVQTAASAAMAVPVWLPSPSAVGTVKPEPVTTLGLGGAAQRKREAPFHLAGAPRATARLARLASEGSAGLGSLPTLSSLGAGPLVPSLGDPSGMQAVDSPHSLAGQGSGGAPVPYHIANSGGYIDTESRAEKLARYRAKKARRCFKKTVRYQTRKDYAEVRPRIKGRFVSPEEYAAWKAEQEQGRKGAGSAALLPAAPQQEDLHVVPTLMGR